MRRGGGRRAAALQHRLVWQGASLLLAYPDDRYPARLESVAEMLGHLDGAAAMQLGRTIAGLPERDVVAAAQAHVQTFDTARSLRLTMWTADSVRERAMHVLAFTDAYRGAAVPRPRGELPDHLTVVLEFAAHVDPEAGRRLLAEHRVPIAALGRAVAEVGSPYAHTLAAVSATLPEVDPAELDRLLNSRRTAEDTVPQAIQQDQSQYHAPNGT